MKPVDFHPGAEADAADALAWYRLRSDRASRSFLADLISAVERIAEVPSRWPQHDDLTRRYALKRFPFLVLYREQADRIEVLAVAHGRRRPGYWRHRQ